MSSKAIVVEALTGDDLPFNWIGQWARVHATLLERAWSYLHCCRQVLIYGHLLAFKAKHSNAVCPCLKEHGLLNGAYAMHEVNKQIDDNLAIVHWQISNDLLMFIKFSTIAIHFSLLACTLGHAVFLTFWTCRFSAKLVACTNASHIVHSQSVCV